MEKFFSDSPNTALFTVGTLVGISIGYLIRSISSKNKTCNLDIVEHADSTDDTSYRMIFGIRTDLKMQKGKVAAQCAHAAVAAYVKAQKNAPEDLKQWKRQGQAKITVKIDSEEEMLVLNKLAKQMGILSCIIRDAGHTQVAPDSMTVIAFGPAPKHVIDKLTGALKLY